MNADLGSDDLQLTIVQCIDLHCSKDAKLFIEIEMPFPHVSKSKLSMLFASCVFNLSMLFSGITLIYFFLLSVINLLLQECGN